MLKLVRRKGRRNLYIRGSVRGQTVYESTETSDKGRADEIRIKREAELLDRSIHGASATATFLEAAVMYMEHGGERRYLASLIERLRSTPLAKIDQRVIDQIASMMKPDTSPATRNRQIYTPIGAVLHFAAERGLCDHIKIRRPKQPRGRVRWLEPSDRKRLIDACSPHMREIVTFMFDTGARVGETLYLDWADVNLQRRTVTFPETKNGEARTIRLTNRVFELMANTNRRDGRVFLTHRGEPYAHRDGGGGQLDKGFKAAVRRAGISDFHPHDCRHTWATLFYRATKDINALMRLGGWKSFKMVERYVHLDVDHLGAAVDTFEEYVDRAKSVPALSKKDVVC